jgi:hypothetical protein
LIRDELEHDICHFHALDRYAHAASQASDETPFTMNSMVCGEFRIYILSA